MSISERLAALERPVWNCLTGRQAHLAVAQGAAVRIDPRYGPFAAARDCSDEAQAALAATLTRPDDQIWLVETGDWPAPPGTQVLRTATLLQMVAEQPQPPLPGEDAPLALGEADAAEMAALAHATEPGPWGPLTQRYGQFYGVREGERLMAMAGERMLPAPGLAELSGVCTWPEFRGRGLAAQLICHVMAAQLARGDMPYLHVYAANTGAIRIYEALGFRATREMVASVLALA
ncbi:MAG TPA: GNAT family N-acetyltransferase [Novosphingobium sp.]|nr:GNAT family N-acetyltransferase [Novosphingobium sp.]